MANTIDISGIQTFSDADLLTVYRYALANGGFRKSYTINGRTFDVPDSETVMKTISWLEQRIEDATNGAVGGMVSLAQFGGPGAPQNP